MKMNAEHNLDKETIGDMLNHLLEEELRVVCAYNTVKARMHIMPIAPQLESISKDHAHAVAKLHTAVHNYGQLPARLPPPNPRKQKHLKIVGQDMQDCIPELIWLETDLLREYQTTRKILLSDEDRANILDPAISIMEVNLEKLKAFKSSSTLC